MRSFFWTLVFCAAVIAAAPNNNYKTGACERIHPEELPEECTCSEPHPLSLVIECLKPFNSTYFNDTIGLKIVLDPCDEQGSSISLDITEEDHHINYMIAGIRAGEEKNIPIPGLSIIVPTIGHVGVDAAVLIMGNVDQLTLKVGLNACAVVHQKTLCASSIPGLHTILPWWVLSGTYSFGDLCNATRTTVE
jgi:hypothetical protein